MNTKYVTLHQNFNGIAKYLLVDFCNLLITGYQPYSDIEMSNQNTSTGTDNSSKWIVLLIPIYIQIHSLANNTNTEINIVLITNNFADISANINVLKAKSGRYWYNKYRYGHFISLYKWKRSWEYVLPNLLKQCHLSVYKCENTMLYF